jgi:hypothetical protein
MSVGLVVLIQGALILMLWIVPTAKLPSIANSSTSLWMSHVRLQTVILFVQAERKAPA